MTPDSKVSDAEAREREAFEKWYAAEYLMPPGAFRTFEGTYEKGFVKDAWEAWLARATQQPSAQWIAVTERLPEAGLGGANADVAHVMAAYNGMLATAFYFPDTDAWWSTGKEIDAPEFWMPLEPLRALLPQSPDTMRKG